ncbi:hypothetical protein CDAR_521401 [Caerostris darwini]|uniref:Uncharacterized protein n=1 Tax=Caerostris darwini TaxID=1538125 RepID=A0AAV4MDZ6_9ARAC|nr:hypothetical protein CDAR_521401 [Caerostris darwini]
MMFAWFINPSAASYLTFECDKSFSACRIFWQWSASFVIVGAIVRVEVEVKALVVNGESETGGTGTFEEPLGGLFPVLEQQPSSSTSMISILCFRFGQRFSDSQLFTPTYKPENF